jgi:hypothetical protein
MGLILENDFDILISTDKNLPIQQNLLKLTFGLWILDTPKNDVNTLKMYVLIIIQEIEKTRRTETRI